MYVGGQRLFKYERKITHLFAWPGGKVFLPLRPCSCGDMQHIHFIVWAIFPNTSNVYPGYHLVACSHWSIAAFTPGAIGAKKANKLDLMVLEL